jgi:hypothetical protein
MLLAVDPGVRGCGVAVFDGCELAFAAYIRNPVKKGGGATAWLGMGWEVFERLTALDLNVTEYVIEVPQIYRMSKGDPNDLIDLAGVGAWVGALSRASKAFSYKPREWKGTVKADVFTERIRTWLTPDEVASIEPCAKSLEHNVIDAVGLGIVHLRKTGRRE